MVQVWAHTTCNCLCVWRRRIMTWRVFSLSATSPYSSSFSFLFSFMCLMGPMPLSVCVRPGLLLHMPSLCTAKAHAKESGNDSNGDHCAGTSQGSASCIGTRLLAGNTSTDSHGTSLSW